MYIWIKKDVVYTENEMLLSHKEEWNLTIKDNMDGFKGITLSEISQRSTNIV